MKNEIRKLLEKVARRIRNYKWKFLLANFGDNSQICSNAVITDPQWTHIGSYSRINHQVVLLAMSEKSYIKIGDNVSISFGAKLLCGGRDVINGRISNSHREDKIIVGDNVWIGAGAIILQGVEIGENSIIAANAVVLNNVSEGTVVGGIPAKVIAKL